jgi:hypothetical protein
MRQFELVFATTVAVSAARAWQWVTSIEGISTELSPLLRMTYPASASRLTVAEVEPGRRLFRSWILLFGLFPIDRSDLTVVLLEPGRRFVERSPMLTMAQWQHERSVEPAGPERAVITDRLTFSPRFSGALVAWLIERIFRHRHRRLRRWLTTP